MYGEGFHMWSKVLSMIGIPYMRECLHVEEGPINHSIPLAKRRNGSLEMK